MTLAKGLLAMVPMGKPDAMVSGLCNELGISRQTRAGSCVAVETGVSPSRVMTVVYQTSQTPPSGTPGSWDMLIGT